MGKRRTNAALFINNLDNSIDTNLVRLRQDETQASDGNYEPNRVTTPGQTTKLYLRIYKDLVWHCFMDG